MEAVILSQTLVSKVMDLKRKLNICIISHMAYGAIKGGNSGHAGGVEFQTSLLAKWLASRGHRVSFITWDEGGPKEEFIQGVRVIKLCKMSDGIPGFRFFHPRWTSLVKALKRAEAEIYYHNLGEYVTGQIALWSKIKNKKFVYYIASDDECTKIPLRNSRFYDRLFFKLALKLADLIFAQTRIQCGMLKNNFGLESVLVPMPCSFSVDSNLLNPIEKRKQEILWIGRISKEKRPELLLKIARTLPEYLFHVIGKPSGEYLSNSTFLEHFHSTANIKYYGMVPHNELPKFYNSAMLFLNTSEYEGFPNTFLEAWGFGLPIISTFDPDNIIQKKKIGFYSRGFEDLVKGIKQLLTSKKLWLKYSDAAQKYYKEKHFPQIALERIESLFLQIQ